MTLSSDGNTLYGTTKFDGANGDGMVFGLPVSGGSPTVLASFNYSSGEYPEAGLTLIGNNLYGTTEFGGANGDGTVFSLPVSGGSPTVLASFDDGSIGGCPAAGLTLIGNTLYGTTTTGGAYGDGTVFALDLTPAPEPSTFTLLAAGTIGLIGWAWRRRKGRHSQAATASGEDDIPALLSFPSQPTQRTTIARRAA